MRATPASSLVASLLLCLATACGGGTANAPGPRDTAAPTDTAAPPAAPAALQAPDFRLPDTARPTAYAATLTLDPSAPTFSGEITIDVELGEATSVLWLNGRDLTVTEASASIADRTLAATASAAGEDFIALQLAEAIGPGAVRLHLAYDGKVSDTELSGVFRQQEIGDWYLYTQFEAISARQAFPCFDEPQHKTPWQLSLRVRAGQRAFANTPELRSAEGDDGWVTYEFARSKPMPSYLVAFAVGPFDIVDAGTAGRNQTPLRIIVPRGVQSQARYAARTTAEVLTALEAYFDSPYPYAKLDSIAVPHFFGAMENPGLVTYAQRLILRAPADEAPAFYRAYTGIAAHELAHQWFGNLVTMAWWDDLWLNESFATWMAAKIVDQLHPEWGGAVYRVGRREQAMASDALPTAKPIRQPVAKRDDIFGGGSAILYAKGASVLATFEAWVGEDELRAGIRDYMRQHAWGNATAADFLAALGAQSSAQLAGAFATFIDQPGYPLITASLVCEPGKRPRLALGQQRYVPTGGQLAGDAAATTWQIPVCARYDGGRDCTLVTEATAELELTGAKRCPTWVLANADATGYYRVAYDGDLLERNLLGAGARKLSLPERVMAIGDARALVDAGKLSPAAAFTMVPKLVAREQNTHVIASTVEIVKGVEAHLVAEAARPSYARFIRKLYGKRARALGFASKPGESDDTRMLRPRLVALVALQGDDQPLIRQATAQAEAWLEDRTAVQPDMVETVLQIAATHGDLALYDRLYEAARTTNQRDERTTMLSAMAAFTSAKLVEHNVELMLGDEFELREAAVFMQRPLSNPVTRELAYGLIKSHFDEIVAKLPRFYARFIVYTAASFCDEAHVDDAKAFFGPRVKDMMGGTDALEQVVQQIQICSAQREAQQPEVTKFLKRY